MQDNNNNKATTTSTGTPTPTAIFENDDESFAKQMKDRVGAIHEYFDKDGDGYLNFEELRSLQLITGGDDMDGNTFVSVCRVLDCKPTTGITLNALRITYASDGASIDKDFATIFPDKAKKENNAGSTKRTHEKDNGDDVIEAGEGGFDISI